MWKAESIVKDKEGICLIQWREQLNGGLRIDFSQNKGGFSSQGEAIPKISSTSVIITANYRRYAVNLMEVCYQTTMNSCNSLDNIGSTAWRSSVRV
jgi:hypothetical protein